MLERETSEHLKSPVEQIIYSSLGQHLKLRDSFKQEVKKHEKLIRFRNNFLQKMMKGNNRQANQSPMGE